MTQTTVPALLNIPPLCLPMLSEFNSHRYFLLQGGRGSGKTHSVARFLLYLAGTTKLRIVCGRETQNSIEESVHTVLRDLIEDFDLFYEITAKKITHKKTGSVFLFKGFREQGRVNTKGMERVDVLWIDEAQSITHDTLETLVPTIVRVEKAKLFFTMNRFMREDAVVGFLQKGCTGDGGYREDCLNIEINYLDNPFCSPAIKIEAENLKAKSEREFQHVYMNVPLDSAENYLFNYAKLAESRTIEPIGELQVGARVMAFDFAARGADQCVATVLDRVSPVHFRVEAQVAWDENDAMVSIGKIVDLIGTYRPDVSILDVGGMGHVVWNRLQEIGVGIERFDGAGTKSMGIDGVHYANARAHGYYTVKDWFDRGWLIMGSGNNDCIKELESIEMKFRSDGKRLLMPKTDMDKSPDRADSLMMAVWAATKYLGDGVGHGTARVARRVTGHRRLR